MKSKFIKTITLAMCFLFSFNAFACGGANSSDKLFNFADGKHIIDYSETSAMLVDNGFSDYSIVIEEDASDRIIFAAQELQELFKEATDIHLNIVRDTGLTHNSNQKYISLGQTTLLESANLSSLITESLLERDGYIIKTVDNNIYISGVLESGTVFGVYGFLRIEFNFDCYSNNYYYIDEGVKNVKLKNFNVVDVPDMVSRKLTNPYMTEKEQTLYRMGLNLPTSIYAGDTSAHSSFVYLPKDKYQADHPKWYSVDGTQLCWTARGDDKELKLMQETVAQKMISYLKSDGYILSFTQADKYTWCTCDRCTEIAAHYNGSNGAVMVMFCNKLAEIIDAYMESPEGSQYKKDYQIQFLAYNKTLGAPINYNAKTDKFTLIDGLKTHKNVSAYIAPIEKSFVKSIKDKENERFDIAIRGWAEICDNVSYFDYISNYNNFMVSYDVFNTLQESYQMMATYNCVLYSALGQYGQSGAATGWQILRSYLCSKLAWDVNIDMNAAINKFFEYYYGAGAENMLKYFNEYRIQSKKITVDGTMDATGVYGRVVGKAYFPLEMVKRWINYCDSAIEDIYYLQKVDMAMYNLIYEHIITERISLYYIIAQYFSSDCDGDYVQAVKEQCRTDANRVGVTAMAEGVPISSLWDSWKLN